MLKGKNRWFQAIGTVAIAAVLAVAAGVFTMQAQAEAPGSACPACKKSVEWVAFTGKEAITVTDGHLHLYLAEDVTETISEQAIIQVSGVKKEGTTENLTYGSVCFNLNGHTLTVDNGYLWLDNDCKDYASTLNIIGTNGGVIRYSGGPVVKQNYGNLNIYGGTYIPANGENFADCVTRNVVLVDADVQGDIVSQAKATCVTLKGKTKVGTIDFGTYNCDSALKLDSTWAGSAALLPKEDAMVDGILSSQYTYAGTPGGNLTLANGEKLECQNGAIALYGRLVLDSAGKGLCLACNKTVQWTEFTGQTVTVANGSHDHYYMTEDIDTSVLGADAPQYIIDLRPQQKLCFHLNGKTLTTGSGIYIYGGDDSSTVLNIIGYGGQYVYTANRTSVGMNLEYDLLRLYGGTYTYAPAAGKSGTLIRVRRYPTFKDATINGTVVVAVKQAVIYLDGSTTISRIDYKGYNARVEARVGWTGSAELKLPTNAVVNGVVSADRVVCNPKPTGELGGKLTLSTGEKLAYRNGQLEVPGLYVAADGYANCTVCNTSVKWTKFDGKKGFAVTNSHQHFYLDEDTEYAQVAGDMLTLGAGGKACFHLNGYTLMAHDAAFRLTDESAVLNIIGDNGTIGFAKTGLIQQTAGTVNVRGGTYSPVYGVPFAQASGTVNLQDATVNGNLIGQSTSAVFRLQGNTKTAKINLDDGGKLTLSSDWNGTATLDMEVADLAGGKVPARYVSYTGTPSGTVKLASGRTLNYVDGTLAKPAELVLDGQGRGLCPLCNEKVTWTALDTDGMIFTGETAGHHHVYLTDNVYSTSGVELLKVQANQTVCLHLNGYDLTTGSVIHAAGGEVNIYAYGSNYTFTGDDADLYSDTSGALNLYGGTFNGIFGLKILDAAMRIEDATVNVDVIMDNTASQLTIAGDTNITGNIRFGTSSLLGNLIVDKSFSGAVTVENRSGLITSKRGSFNWSTLSYTYTYTFNNGTANGDFTGDLKISNGQRMINNSGTLKAALVADPLSWKKLDAMPVANNSMTEEELRQLCVDFFRTTLSFAWTPKEDAYYQNKETNPELEFKKDTVYGGTPYVTATTGTVYTAMEYYDPITGTLNISGDAKDTIMNFSNQCSGSAFWAWNRVCTSIKYTDTDTTLLGYGCLRVGPYTYPDSWLRWDKSSNSTMLVCQTNGEQVMYESYAQTKPADGILTVRPNAEDLPANGHNRMVSSYPVVVRNADGTINGEKSYLYYIDQDGEFSSDTQADGTAYTRIGVDTKFTFANIYKEGYIPFTFAELIGEKPVDESVTSMSYTGKTVTVEQLAAATVSSNYSISDITVTVKDAQGNQVYRKLTCSRYYNQYQGLNLKVDVSVAVDAEALAAYTDGRHTVEVSVRIGTGEKPVVYEGLLCVTGFAKITDTETIWYDSAAEAIGAYTAADFKAGNYIRLYKDASVSLVGDDSYYIDGAGYNVNVTGEGILYAMDSANAESFVCSGQWNVAQETEIVRDFVAPDGTRYLVTTDAEGVTTTHALVLELAGVTVNTEKVGLGYEAQYKCDDSLAEMISAYGIIVSLKDMPGKDLEKGDCCTVLHNFAPDDNHEVLSGSSYVYGIFKTTRPTAAENALCGRSKIYANPYIRLDEDGDGVMDMVVSDNENVGQQAGNAWSLYDVLKHIDDNWQSFGAKDAVNAFYGAWKDQGMSQYDFTNIA